MTHIIKMYAKKIYEQNGFLNGLLVLVFFLFAIQPISELRNIVIVDDQLGYWGIAARLAGYDWSEMVSMTAYYGFGYPIILVPLFWLSAEPAIIYQLSIMLNIGMLIASFFLAISCARILFPSMNRTLRSFICFLVIVYGNNMAQMYTAWTETLLYLLFWLIFYLILLMEHHFSYKKLFLLIFVCGYMYAVHQRSVGVCIAVFLVLMTKLYFNFERKKRFLGEGIAVVFAIMLLLGITVFKNVLVSTLWGSADADVVSLSDYGGQIDKVKYLLNAKGLTEFFQSICGRIYYLIAGTLFSGAFGFVYTIRKIWSYAVCGRKWGAEKDDMKMQPGLIPFLFIFLSLLAELGISAVFMYLDHSRIDILVYGRYMEFVFGPLMLLGFGFLINRKPVMEFAGISIVFLICAVIVESLYEDMRNLPFNHICASQLLQFFYNWKKWERLHLFFGISLLIILAMLLVLMTLRKKIWLGCIVLIIVSLKLWGGNLDSVMKINENWNSRFVESFNPVREFLKENGIEEITFLDSKSEVADVNVNEDTYMKQLQFTLYDITVHRKVITDAPNLMLEEDKWYIFQTGIAEENAIKNMGVESVLDNDCFVIIKSD